MVTLRYLKQRKMPAHDFCLLKTLRKFFLLLIIDF